MEEKNTRKEVLENVKNLITGGPNPPDGVIEEYPFLRQHLNRVRAAKNLASITEKTIKKKIKGE